MDEFLFVAILVVMGFLPSLVWLLFYLHQSTHPEPKQLVARTFLMGIVLAPWAVLIQLIFTETSIGNTPYLFFFFAALVEELVKYMAVRYAVLNDPNFIEPVDAMVYMIIASLGFAAIENVLVLFNNLSFFDISGTLKDTLYIWSSRFLGATVLHAMASGIVGYFLAISWFYKHHSKKLIFIGLALGTILHFTFNSALFISEQTRQFPIEYISTGLIAVVILILILFAKLRKRRGIESYEEIIH